LTISEVHLKKITDEKESREKEGRRVSQTSFSLIVIEFVKSTYVINENNSSIQEMEIQSR
jgi:hypothetical protein